MTRFEKIVCGVALAAGLVIPFLLDSYTIRVAAMALYYIILASSWNLLLGYAGQLSFAHAAFAGIGAYTSGLLSYHYGVHPGFGIFIGGAVAAETRVLPIFSSIRHEPGLHSPNDSSRWPKVPLTQKPTPEASSIVSGQQIGGRSSSAPARPICLTRTRSWSPRRPRCWTTC